MAKRPTRKPAKPLAAKTITEPPEEVPADEPPEEVPAEEITPPFEMPDAPPPPAVTAIADGRIDVGNAVIQNADDTVCAVEPHSVTITPLVSITVPLGEEPLLGYFSSKAEARLKTLDQRIALRRLTESLRADHAQTVDGRHVDTAADAIRWLLEQLHQGYTLPTA